MVDKRMAYLKKICAFSFSLLLTSHATAEQSQYTGLCEASGATIISDELFAVASDDIDAVAVYRLSEPNPIFWSDDLGKISDLEASASIGNVTFWVTSHSLTKSGKDKKSRKKLLATVNINNVPVEIGHKFDGLRGLLATSLADDLPTAQIDDSDNSSLNIEGMASTSKGELLLGLRAPLSDMGHAIIVNIGDPFGLIELPSSLQPTSNTNPIVSFVRLGGRGIRSIHRIPETDEYMIVAGASEDEEADFALFRWNGAEGITQVTDVDFTGQRPESMIIWPNGNVQIFGDNGGTHCSDDEDDSDAREAWFPSTTVSLVPD